MQIDWFTVGAQVANFLILVYLLKRFLYGPIVNAMDRREQRVTGRLREAREREEQAEERAARLREEREELDARRRELLDEARKEAEQRRRDLLEEVREEIEETRRRWREEVDRERESFLGELRDHAATWMAGAARHVLRELADAELEERVVRVFQERLRKLGEDERERLGEAVREADEPLRVVTAFGLSGDARDGLRQVLEEVTGRTAELRFVDSPDLVCGIELRTPGTTVAWSIDAFVRDLEDEVAESLRRAARGDAEETGREGAERSAPAPPEGEEEAAGRAGDGTGDEEEDEEGDA